MQSEMVQVMKILFFAQAQSIAGTAQAEWRMDSQITFDAFWNRLLREYPQLTPLRPSLRVAVNFEFADSGTLFGDGDEVAIIPPVSGG
jgi:molybdopterin synthase catalytic subunit/molybdopterin synthase sulfur carrier subunit